MFEGTIASLSELVRAVDTKATHTNEMLASETLKQTSEMLARLKTHISQELPGCPRYHSEAALRRLQ